nr:MAG TPA: hypothetical protein [Caudoviricetes sp.]
MSVDFRLGATRVGLPRLRMPPVVICYRGGSALRSSPLRSDRTIQTPRDCGVILFLPPHDII